MKKITLEVVVPASGNKYEMRFPRNIKVSDAEKMVNDYLRLRSDESFVPGADTLLCSSGSGRPLEGNLFIEELGLGNGDKLFVI